MSTKNDASFSGKLFPDSPLGLQKPRSRSPLYALQAPFPDKSPLTDYKWQFLKRKIDEIQPLYFRSTRDTGEGNISVLNESPATFDLSYKDFTVYYDTDGEEGFQREKDVFAYRIRVFVSTDGNKIKEAYEACGQANDNEICFFIEDNTDDYSNARLYALFGKSVDKNILSQLLKESNDLSRYLNSVPDINANILRELIEKGVIVYPAGIIKSLVVGITSMTKFVTIIGKGVGWLVETLGNGILEYLSIPETVWNTDSDEYFFQKDKLIDLLSISPQTLLRIEQTLFSKGKNPVLDHLSPTFMGENFMKISGALEGFIEQYNGFVRKKVEEIIAIATVADTVYPISEVFAFLCGLWNGLVDFIGGTLTFIGHLLQMPYDIFDDIDSAIETFDNICQGIRNLWNNIGDAFSQMYETFLEYLKKQDGNDINPDKVAYITGFGVAFVASLFVPVAQLARVAKFSKVGKSMLPANFLDDITTGIGKGVDYLKDTSRAAANSARKAIDEMVALMMLGADKFRKVIKDLIEKIFAWINKNKKLLEARKFLKEIDNYLALRKKFHDLDLVNKLWKERIVSKQLYTNQLKRLYSKYLDSYPALKKGFNQAEFKTTIKKKGELVEEVEEFSISGKRTKLIDEFGNPPELPPNTINVLDDYDNFERFVEGAVDFAGQARKYDSEIKYIFNFLKNHVNKGDEFIIETKNIFKTCGSCRRELVMLEEYLRSIGKRVKIIVHSDEGIEGTRMLKDKLKIK